MSLKLKSEEVRENKPSGFIKIFVCIAGTILLGFIVFSIVSSEIEINKNEELYNQLLQQTEAIQEENDSIERYLREGANMDEYVEEIARDKLNFANPDERVYYIVPSGE